MDRRNQGGNGGGVGTIKWVIHRAAINPSRIKPIMSYLSNRAMRHHDMTNTEREAVDPAPAPFAPHGSSSGYAESERRTVSAIRSAVGRIMSSRMSAAGSGRWGVVIRTGGPSRS
jgi:hypothetical protein